MGVLFTPQESGVLYRLLAEDTRDVILKTDHRGFILHASAAIARLGFAPPHDLVGSQLADLARGDWAPALRAHHAAVMRGHDDGRWLEFAAPRVGGGEAWFEIQLRALPDGAGRPYGTISIMRCIDDRRRFERDLFIASMTDPLTGLTNRRAFIHMTEHMVERGQRGCVAILAIDHFKALNLRYGQKVGDEVLVVFAELVRTMLQRDDIISRIGGESLGVILPHCGPGEAADRCGQIITTLAEIGALESASSLPITASAGLARIGGSLDETLRRAELALALARGKGRSRLEIDYALPDDTAH